MQSSHLWKNILKKIRFFKKISSFLLNDTPINNRSFLIKKSLHLLNNPRIYKWSLFIKKKNHLIY